MDFYADASMGSDMDVGGLLSSVYSQELGSAAFGQLPSEPYTQPDQPNTGVPAKALNRPFYGKNTRNSLQ